MDKPVVSEEFADARRAREAERRSREEERARHHNNILRRLRVALREDPPGDRHVMGWLVRHFAPNAEDVLQAYQVLLQGAFGRVAPVPGNPPEEAYPCGAKTLHAHPARLHEHEARAFADVLEEDDDA